ncbi:zinc finger, CCHC-type, retrotransposon gag domain protein, partial [Tanacetum coccineum]
MVDERRKEVQKASTSKGAESPIGDTIRGESENESSSDSEGLNYGGFTEEETKALKSMINRQVGKKIKNVMPYYISRTTENLKEVIRKELEELKKGGMMSDSRNEMATYRDFTACDVPKFDGMLDPIACTKWLSAVEGAFRTSGCKEKNKVNFASNFLRDSAKMWWEGKICEKGSDEGKLLGGTKDVLQEFANPNVVIEEVIAYFVDSLLFGLMRTTSRSESENSFFKSFTSPETTLVSFMMSYESAMERQMYRQEALDFKTIEAAPKRETKLPIELQAARVYTRMIFLLVQTEIIQGCWTCMIQELKINKGCETVIIRDKKPKDNTTLNTKKGKEQEKKTGTVAETARDYK